MPLVLAAVLGVAGLLFVIYPLLGAAQPLASTGDPAPAAELADGERLARTALREVEFDHSLGNLDDGDYTALRQRYERRALAALKQRYEREQALDARIERELAELRAREETADPHRANASTIPSPRQGEGRGRGSYEVATQPRSNHPPVLRGPHARRRKGR